MTARIVVIENDANLRALFAAALSSQGWQVFGYPYAQADMAAVEQHRPNLIILDINGQDIGRGWEFLQLLKMNDQTARTPILITTTAMELPAEIRDYLLTRYIFVIHKPFDFKILVNLVRETLLQAAQAGDLFSSDLNLPILLVDDREDLRNNVMMILGFEGYEVVTAYNGLVALKTVSRADHCLILLDISMPVMNGYEFLVAYNDQLRPHSPVIILSGQEDIRAHTLPAFVVDVFTKPFLISPFLSVVGKYARPN